VTIATRRPGADADELADAGDRQWDEVASAERPRHSTRGRIAVIGAPTSAGAFAIGQEEAPRAMRAAGLIDGLRRSGADVRDEGDSTNWPWRPDRVRPRAQNLDAVIEQIGVTRNRVARVAETGSFALVLGGDCTVGMGTVAGITDVADSVGLVYFDLHADMNTPESVIDGALDWMGMAHMLAIDGTERARAHPDRSTHATSRGLRCCALWA
jgi:arginase